MTSYMTKYGVINVKDTIYCGEKVRTMYMGGAGESSTFLDPGRKYELVSKYTALFDKAFDINPAIQTVLMIGGGGFSYPKHVISQRPDVFMDVVEINRKCLELSLRYFFLKDLIEEYDLINTKRLAFIIGDGREFISNVGNGSYELVINDAFMGVAAVSRSIRDPRYQVIDEHQNPEYSDNRQVPDVYPRTPGDCTGG